MDDQSTTEKRSAAFTWNKGGWLGAQLGGTCWILILGVLLLPTDPVAGVIALVCFTVPNLIGWRMWRRRAQLSPYRSIQTMVAVEGLFALIVVASMHLRQAMQLLPEGSQVSIGTMYGVLLVFPAIAFQFWLQEHETRKGLERLAAEDEAG